ncbi:MAG: lysozyme [Crocosphaera sp.]|nr:lysozyme [Crocosphaera sp.]
MRKNPKKVNSNKKYYINFVVAFLVGLALVLGFAILTSLTAQINEDLYLFGIKFKPEYLSLTLSGAFGALLYSILLDGGLEVPTWGEKGNRLKLGSIGEVLVGIGGAFTTYLFAHKIFGVTTGVPDQENGVDQAISLFVTGLIGGYGGKYILDAALKKVIKRIGEVDLVKEQKEELAQQVEKLNEEQKLIKQVNRQINEGLPPSEIFGLSEKIKNAPEELKHEAFMMAKEIRRLSWRSKTAKPKIVNTIPIFEALVDSDRRNDKYHAQLAYACKDCVPPRLDDSISAINEAINLRGSQIVGNTFKYELCRALARIMEEEPEKGDNDKVSPWREEILTDLLSVDRNYGLAKILIESENEVVDIPLKDWLAENQDWIRQQSGGSNLLQKAFNVSLSSTPQSSNLVESGALTKTLGSRKSVAELKEAISGYVSTRSLRNGRRSVSKPVINTNNTDHLETATTKIKIKATHKTYLKKHPIDSSELLENQKVLVLEGKEYTVVKHSPVVKHPQETQVVHPTSNHIPKAGIELIKKFEGYRQNAYADPIHGWGVPTIGYGTTRYPNGSKVKRGDTTTKAKAEEYLIDHIDETCRPALEKIPTWKQMNDNQRGAIYSFAYNLGAAFYGGSGFASITKVCNSPHRWNDQAWVKAQFVKYRNPGTSAEAGLRRRRQEEAQLFCKPSSSSTTTVSKEKQIPKYSGETNGHCQVELAYGAGVWYIWPDHWDLPWIEAQHDDDDDDDQELFGDLKLGNDLASRIIKYMKTKGYQVSTQPKEYNIVYVEGMNPDGSLNDDRPNCFNDLRMVIEFSNGKPKIVGNWIATTEPGSKATLHGLAKGAARIKFGQYKSWIIAWHPMPKSARSHEALYQQKPVTVHRDFNKDYQRTGDKLETGLFGINQHWGWDQPVNNISNTSAGCLVGRTRKGHREFMAILKQDKRYRAKRNYVFYTTIIPGDDLNKQFPPN